MTPGVAASFVPVLAVALAAGAAQDPLRVVVPGDALAPLRALEVGDVAVIEEVDLGAGRSGDLQVERFAVTGSSTAFVIGRRGGADEPLAFDASRLVLLRGTIVDHPGSHVYMALTDAGAMGTVDLGAGGPRAALVLSGAAPLFAGPADGGAGLPPPLDRICGVADRGAARKPAGAVAGLAPAGPWQIEVAAETDYEYFSLFGDADTAAAYVTVLYGAIGAVYERDLASRLVLSFVRLWDRPDDPYNEADPLDTFQTLWNDTMQSVPRDVAQLLSGRRNLPYGGVAYVEALCGPFAYSVCGYLNGSFAGLDLSSSGNWDLVVTAHELGHNCGTLHTHDYGLDNCGSGDVQRGGIMSYCHIVSGGVANVDLRFETFIQGVVRDFLATSECLVLDCNGNGVSDAADVSVGQSLDLNDNGVPDECEDCNGNGTLDNQDIASGASDDDNGNGIPDDCESDCNGNGMPDDLDIAQGNSDDAYGDGVPDECEDDCDGDATADYSEIQATMSLDVDRSRSLDDCQDCDGDGTTDFEDLDGGLNVWVGSATHGQLREFHAASGAPVKSSSGGALLDVQDVVLGPDGLLYVSVASGHRVVRVNPSSGIVLGNFVPGGSGGLSGPAMLAFKPDGDLLVASRGTEQVLEYDGTTGAFEGAFVTAGSGGLVDPFGLAFGPGGNLYVSTGNHRVLEYNGSSGAFLGTFVSNGSGGLSVPRGLLFKPGGNLLVASAGTNAVLEYDGSSGAFVGRFDLGGLPQGFWGLAEPFALRLSPRGDVVHVSASAGNTAIHSYDLESGRFMRSFYVLSADIADATGFAVLPPSPADRNMNLVPDQCERRPCPADVTGEGEVDVQDLVAVILGFGPCGDPPAPCPADVTGEGEVDVQDLVEVILGWGSCG